MIHKSARIGLQILMLSGALAAAPLKWNISANFVDGGVVDGFFILDASTGTFSGLDVHVSGGDTANFPEFHYTDPTLASYFTDNATFGRVDFQDAPISNRYMTLLLALPLTGAGGTINILYSGNGTTSYECVNCFPWRDIGRGGFVTAIATDVPGSTTPEPASWAMMIAGGVVALAHRRWRLRRSQ